MVPIYSLIPFILMLISIAVIPVVSEKFWDSNRNKLIISLILGIPAIIWLLLNGLTHELEHALLFDYVPFIILLFGLFVVTGGIFVDGDIEAKPKNNTILLIIGTVLASFMGTTGAAMLLIRTLIKINSERKHKAHSVMFFIATVANAGGLLTPIGDPPLFMMYLRGVPFDWFFRLAPEWFLTNSLLLIIYFFVDRYYYAKEDKDRIERDKKELQPIKIVGNLNFLWLVGIVLAVAFINPNYFPVFKENHYLTFSREAVILVFAGLSMLLTNKAIRKANNFNWHPIEEVAFLFFGIFSTMVPAIVYLEHHASEFGISSPFSFYYSTGILSAFLDNTPTAVTFYSLALGLVNEFPQQFAGMDLIAGIPISIMIAISLSSVFFGGMSYIGNGPNFMVKAIAEKEGVPMPHFFAYIYKFSLIYLLPIFILVQLLFVW